MIQVLDTAMAVIILQYVNQNVVLLKVIQCYVSIISQ